MRLRTIWTLPACTLAERLRRTRDWAAGEVAAHLPLRVRYFSAMQELAYATRKSENIPATPLGFVLRNLRAPSNLS